MTYRCGIGDSLAKVMGVTGRLDPHLTCDECGRQVSVLDRYGMPSQTWMNKSTVRGWLTVETSVSGVESAESIRRDYCPECRKALKKKGRAS